MSLSKSSKKIYILVFTLLLVAILNACKSDDDALVVTNIQLNETEVTTNVGEEVVLSITSETFGNTAVWRSSDESIAIVNNQGIVTTLAGGIAAISATINGAQATCIISVDPDVFFIQREVEDEIPVFWKNGQATNLGDKIDIILNSIFIYQEDIYVTGEEWFSNGNGFLWKNGEMQNLPASSGQINELKSFIKEDDIEYMCGEVTVDNEQIPVYWINGIENAMETTPPSSPLFQNWRVDVYDMDVENEDIYIVGNQRVSSAENLATLWKNQDIQTFSGDVATFRFNSVYVKGSDVFVAGDERLSNTELKARYWKNGMVVNLFSDNNSAIAQSITVSDNGDIYVAGIQFLGTESQAVYWKNGELIILDDGSDDSSTDDIFIFGNDVYIAGTSRNLDSKFAYWKNGVPVTVDGVESRMGSWSVFVR